MANRIAVITARGGSKRIPGKNIKPFAGRPIIEYAIEAALNSQVVDHVLVSTDDSEIASIASRAGADAPFVRPAHLANDTVGSIDVMRHAIDWFSDNRGEVAHACCLFPTSPFLSAEQLTEGYRRLVGSENAEFCFPVTSFAASIYRSLRISSGGQVEMNWPEYERKRTQELPEAFHDAGVFYWGTREAFMVRTGFYTARSVAIELPRHLVHDLDTLEDWERAELVYRAWQSSQRPSSSYRVDSSPGLPIPDASKPVAS